jgi:hypothetical protein
MPTGPRRRVLRSGNDRLEAVALGPPGRGNQTRRPICRYEGICVRGFPSIAGPANYQSHDVSPRRSFL